MRANGASSYDLLDGAPLAELVHPTAFANLDLVPAKPDLAGAVVELSGRADGERYLAQALASGCDRYDFVFLDCPPSLGPLTVNALAAADRVLVPVQAEYYALEGLTQLVRSVELVRARLNPKLVLGGLVLTMVDGRTRLAADVVQEVRRHFGPLVFRARPAGGYELIAGERRWRAAREAGVASVPALVREADDRDSVLLALVENVAREQLSAVEEARAYAVLIDEFDLSLGEVAERVGRSKPSVSNRLRLLELPEEVLWMLARGEISEGHARAVLALPEHDDRRRLAKRIAERGLSVREAERAARSAGARTRPRQRRAQPVDPVL